MPIYSSGFVNMIIVTGSTSIYMGFNYKKPCYIIPITIVTLHNNKII